MLGPGPQVRHPWPAASAQIFVGRPSMTLRTVTKATPVSGAGESAARVDRGGSSSGDDAAFLCKFMLVAFISGTFPFGRGFGGVRRVLAPGTSYTNADATPSGDPDPAMGPPARVPSKVLTMATTPRGYPNAAGPPARPPIPWPQGPRAPCPVGSVVRANRSHRHRRRVRAHLPF